jgi:hypothetical protein
MVLTAKPSLAPKTISVRLVVCVLLAITLRHWDQYADRNDLWWHFARFAEVLKQVDVPGEDFKQKQIENPRLRVYVLKGQHYPDLVPGSEEQLANRA